MQQSLASSDYEFLRVFRFGSERAWDDDAAVSDAAVGEVLLLGDIHNSRQVFDAALSAALDHRCDALVQVGDFWLQDCSWWDYAPDRAALMHSAVHSPIPVVVLDGNHEVWPCLTEFQQLPASAAPRRLGRPLHLGGSLWWADRGSTWSWAGRRFGALGGATSPDRWGDLAKYRWEHETTTREDLDRLVDNAPDGLDILICHDAPAGTTGLTIGLLRKLHPYLQHEADTVKALLRSAVDETEPTLVVHGHWHQQNRCRLIHSSTEAVGLAGDGRPGCAAILSISDMHARYLGPLDPPAADTPHP